MADFCARCGIPLRIGSESNYCSEHDGSTLNSDQPSASSTQSSTTQQLQASSAEQTPIQRQLEKIQKEEEQRRKAFFEAAPSFTQLVGQRECVERLKRFGEFYVSRTQVPEHILITGGDGMGKRMFARAFAKTFNTAIREMVAEEFERKGDLTPVLTSLEAQEAFLILNIQELRKPLTEMLQPALEHFRIDLVIGQGPGARVHPFNVNRFTCIATTPKAGDIPPDLLRCFSLSLTLQPYSNQELKEMTVTLASNLGLSLSETVVAMILDASDHTPHSIEQMLRRFSRLGKPTITETDAREAFAAFGLASHQQAKATNGTDLDRLSGVEFERLITSMLGRMGFRAEMTRATGDGGIDIVAHLDRPIVGGRYLIQCKRFAGAVGAPIVREFYGAVQADRRAVKGILITTSQFTDQAREFAENLPIELIDRNKLNVLLAEMQHLDAT